MNRYQLAKLVEWAGTLQTRKRLQKVVYLLQAAGCPLGADYTLHHFGPYSYDVAQLADGMVQSGLLEEDEAPNMMAGRSFSYRLSERARGQMGRLEHVPGIREGLHELERFEPQARQLLAESVQTLELAATIAYFHRQEGNTWQAAREAAARFKNQNPESSIMQSAEGFARQLF